MKPCYIILGSVLAWISGANLLADEYLPDKSGYLKNAVPMFKKYCIECHGPEKTKGGFRVDIDLPNNFQDHAVNEKWHEVLNILNEGEMPPEKALQPTAEMVAATTSWIEQEMDRAEEARTGSKVVLRRLNRAEYDNTMRDLIGLPLDMKLSEKFGFPEDPTTEGFDNVGGTLMMSMMQLELYLEAAEYVIERAIVKGSQPPSVNWRIRLNEHSPNEFIDVQPWEPGKRTRVCVRPGHYAQDVFDLIKRDEWVELRRKGQQGGYDFIENPFGGVYRIRARMAADIPPREEIARRIEEAVRATRRNLDPERLEAEVKRFRGYAMEDWRFDYRAARGALIVRESGQPRTVEQFDVTAAPSQGEEREWRVWLDPGRQDIKVVNDYNLGKGLHIPIGFHQEKANAPFPYVLVDWLEMEGPVFEEWPPAYHRRILHESPLRESDEKAYAREVLANFMRRAFRRPPTDAEVDAKMAIYERARPDFAAFEDAIKEPLISVLTSPHFLFIVEPEAGTGSVKVAERVFKSPSGKSLRATAVGRTADAVRVQHGNKTGMFPIAAFSSADQAFIRQLPTVAKVPKGRVLDNFEIASRLSYFLWSSMPDEDLLQLAEGGEIRKPEVLLDQVTRMLKDEKATAFAQNFAGQWLRLRDIGKNPPGELLFPRYDAHLEKSMRLETEAYFAEVLHKNMDVRNFLDSDWVMLNSRLAKFYGIPNVDGDEIRRVALPDGSPRGGVLTQASVLCVTSNGTRTSPVVRGVWILENILNDPPPPPPPNVEEIPQPAPGQSTNTQRERLAVHREIESCSRCHQKIDPLGFALEHFDGSGVYREFEASGQYGRIHNTDPKVDASAQLPDGTEFYGADGLKKELLRRSDHFTACLATKMAIYALGRDMTRSDREMLRGALAHMKKNQNNLRNLIDYIVTSPAFFTK